MKKKKFFLMTLLFLIVFTSGYFIYKTSSPAIAVQKFREGLCNEIVVIKEDEIEDGIMVYSGGETGTEGDIFYCVDFVKRSPLKYEWIGGGGHNHRDIVKGIRDESYILSCHVLNENQNMKPTIFGVIKDDTIKGIEISGDFEDTYEAIIFDGIGDERIYSVNFDFPIANVKIYKVSLKRDDNLNTSFTIIPGGENLEAFNEGKDVLYYRNSKLESYGIGIDKEIAKEIGNLFHLSEKILPSIKHIAEEKYLVSYFEEDVLVINPLYFIYDIGSKNYIPVEYANDYITSIVIDDGKAVFRSKGENIVNGFKKFPLDFTLDVETGKLISEDVYKSLYNYNEEVIMGNWFNETKLNGINVENGKISFDFGISEGSILAGGDFCPNIITKSFKEGRLNVSIENLKYNKNQLKGYSYKETIAGDNVNYTEITFDVSDYTSYNVKFETKDDGVMDMEIVFK